MSKSPGHMNYNLRREMRLRRDKTAALLMPYFLETHGPLVDEDGFDKATMKKCDKFAVEAADVLISELDRTRKDLAPAPEPLAAIVEADKT